MVVGCKIIFYLCKVRLVWYSDTSDTYKWLDVVASAFKLPSVGAAVLSINFNVINKSWNKYNLLYYWQSRKNFTETKLRREKSNNHHHNQHKTQNNENYSTQSQNLSNYEQVIGKSFIHWKVSEAWSFKKYMIVEKPLVQLFQKIWNAI